MQQLANDAVYILDSNTFITPFRNYYSIRYFPSYWQWLKDTFQQNAERLILPEIVYLELIAGGQEDNLSTWVKDNLSSLVYADYRQSPIFWERYAEVLDYIHNSGLFKEPGRSNWDSLNKADPQLVALASINGWKIVTFEERVHNLSPKNPMKKEPKIPNIADHFGAECVNVYELEEEFCLLV